MMRQDTIHINDLSIGYRTKNDTKLVASHIQARIYSGELTCLLGANGVGKSTLLRTLSAFQPKLGGEIAGLGRDMDSYSDKELSTTIGVVLTEKCDIRNMSVRELVEMGRSPYTGFWGRLDKEDKQVVEESIALVRIENLASRMVYTTNKTIFLSTHDLELALQIADKIWLMDRTNGITPGTPEDLALSGHLSGFFARKGIVFDTETGLFRIDNRYSKEIRLIGHGQKYAMVRKALQRNGIRADRHVESPVWIETGDLSVGSAFLIHHLDGRTLAADTIESLLQELSV